MAYIKESSGLASREADSLSEREVDGGCSGDTRHRCASTRRLHLIPLGGVIRDQEGHSTLYCIDLGGRPYLRDVLSVGKTSLARGLSAVLGLAFHRVQFTFNLPPADIVGGLVRPTNALTFRQGPIFTSMVLADELNRASPRTQSALLEAWKRGP